MALIKFITNIFKKIKKLFSKAKKDETGAERLPGERRIGIYGPSNVGKSVFFTMLYQACRQDREFNLSPDDPITGRQLLSNLDTLRSGEWLPGTVEETELNFKASLKGGSQFPFSTRDYKGETVDLEQEGAAREKLIAYFQNCDAILFMISPEMIADPRKCEREIMSFTAMINQVTEAGGKGLRIPIGLMITKADEIEGFEDGRQVNLIDRKAEYLKAKDFNEFVEGVCGQFHVARNIVFQEQVRDLLQRLSLFFDFLMTLSMEFQVFFVSSVGHVRKIEDETGQMSVRPPENPEGIGVKRPFLWVIETIRTREKIAAFNGFRRFVFRLAIVVLAFYSIFYGWQLLPGRQKLVDMSAPPEPWAAANIDQELTGHADRWVVRNFGAFPLPEADAGEIPEKTRMLAANYQAHRWLSEELTQVEGTDALRALATGFRTDAWQRDHAWFTQLRGNQQTYVDEAVHSKITAHNIEVLRRVRELSAGGAGGSEGVFASCEGLLTEFVDPVRNTSDYQRWKEEGRVLCDNILRGESDRQLMQQWLQIGKDLDAMTLATYPLADEMTALRDLATSFADAARGSADEELRQHAETSALLSDQLRNVQRALAPGNEADRMSLLRRVQRDCRRDKTLAPLSRMTGRIIADIEGADREERVGALAQLINERLADPSQLPWLVSKDLERRLSGLRLSGDKQEALELYRSRLEALRGTGAEVTLAVQQAPEGFAVLWWDPIEEDWGQDQIVQGFPLKVRWVAGETVKIGLLRMEEDSARVCESAPTTIFELNGLAQEIACAGSGGVPTEVRFEGLERLLTEQLGDPLGKAFGP